MLDKSMMEKNEDGDGGRREMRDKRRREKNEDDDG